jgi:proteasome lid subunit RPN8/RPN11
MSLRLRSRDLDRIHDHLRQAYPDEGCGVLLGLDRGERREIERVILAENVREDSRHNRYLIAPEHFLAADREGREQGFEVIGFFHSHPDHPARPSAFDLEQAWPYYSYLIVSLERGRVAEMRSWRLAEDRSRFDPEELQLVADGGSQ